MRPTRRSTPSAGSTRPTTRSSPKLKAGPINTAIDELKVIYRLVATPEMRVSAARPTRTTSAISRLRAASAATTARTTTSMDGTLTKESIPSACATCHTFPQIGATNSGVLIGRAAAHPRRPAVGLQPQELGQLARPGQLDLRRLPHPDVLRELPQHHGRQGAPRRHGLQPRRRSSRRPDQACAYCHQPVYCAQCHADPVLPDPFPRPSPVAVRLHLPIAGGATVIEIRS